MAKDPAFLFYSQDFIIGTQFFTNEETGYYIRVMCAIHQHGRLTKDNIEALYGTMPERVFSKFKEDEKGYLFNERLEQEIERRKAFAESRRNNRKKKDENNTSETLVKDMNKTSKTLVKHMETENENIITNTIKEEISEKKWISMPTSDLKIELPVNHIKSAIEQVKITRNVLLTEEKVKGMFSAFKVQNLTGKRWYSDEAAIFSHFLNWLKMQNFKVDQFKSQVTTEELSSEQKRIKLQQQLSKYD